MTALVKVKSEDLKMRGFNALTQSIFDVKTAVFGKKMPDKVSEAEDTEEASNNIVNFRVLKKQTEKLRTTAILLHKTIIKWSFKYEQNRFGKLRIGKGFFNNKRFISCT